MIEKFLSNNHRYQAKDADFRALDILTVLSILAFPLVYLSVRHAVHVSLFLLAGISVFYWLKYSQTKFIHTNETTVWLAVLGLCSIFLSTALAQLIRGEFHIQSFDSSLRIFLAAAVFLYLRTRPISYIKLLEVSLPLGLILLIFAIQDSPARHNWWGNRYSTYFVDPNTLGSQTLLLGLMCFFLIRQVKQNLFITLLKVVGGATALYISIYAGSRGGWLALPFLSILWLTLAFQSDHHENQLSKKQRYIKLINRVLLLSIPLIISYFYIPNISVRVFEAQHDINQWLARVDLNSSAGTRLAMWEISLLQLAPVGGLSGIGDIKSIAAAVAELGLDPIKYREAIINLSFNGPHSDFLDNLLRNGYIGAVAYIMTILAPWIIFWKNRLSSNLNKRTAAHAGLYFLTGIFFCGLANGMITLKYTCSFYGLILACLLAEVLKPDNEHTLIKTAQ
jgi:O-antigen ligase